MVCDCLVTGSTKKESAGGPRPVVFRNFADPYTLFSLFLFLISGGVSQNPSCCSSSFPLTGRRVPLFCQGRAARPRLFFFVAVIGISLCCGNRSNAARLLTSFPSAFFYSSFVQCVSIVYLTPSRLCLSFFFFFFFVHTKGCLFCSFPLSSFFF